MSAPTSQPAAASGSVASGNVSAVPDTMKVVRKLIWLPVLLALLFGITAYLVTGNRGYSAQALVKLGTQNLDQQLLGIQSEGATNGNLIIAETVASIDQLSTAQATAGVLNGSPDLTPEEIDDKVDVAVDTKTFLIGISASDESPIVASKLANAYTQAYIDLRAAADIERMNEIEAQLRKRLAEVKQIQAAALVGLPAREKDIVRRTLSVQPAAEQTQIEQRLNQLTILKKLKPQSVLFARTADIPRAPSGLPPLLFVFVGLFAGGAIGTALAFMIAGRDPKVRAEETAESLLGAPVLVRAPASLASADRATTPFGALRPVEAESARIAAAQLRLNPSSRDARAIAVVAADDATPAAGVALHVAGALARTPFAVLLLDADAKSEGGDSWAQIQRLIDGSPDGAGALTEEDGGDGTLHRLSLPADELRDDRVAAIRAWALQRYDRLVIECPTPDRHAAGVVLLRASDTSVAAISAGKTVRSSLTRLRELAGQIGVPITGSVATGFGGAED